ncbi:hypothetical protein, partial [Xanthovirga aplysinae]|uniref:hypothetical protein n=1 Tax=Xanthovirga aplysinae TaxID=2529853 RepID=UPI001CA3ED44
QHPKLKKQGQSVRLAMAFGFRMSAVLFSGMVLFPNLGSLPLKAKRHRRMRIEIRCHHFIH